jgi:NAD(P)-dependent dehydrogenase (short-subunit alcohol dehydrogenase family)
MSQQLRRVAIVTGAAQGIGFGIAKKLVVNGIDVALIDLLTALLLFIILYIYFRIFENL